MTIDAGVRWSFSILMDAGWTGQSRVRWGMP
jgi:hypothetical protein